VIALNIHRTKRQHLRNARLRRPQDAQEQLVALDRPDMDRLELTQALMRALIKQIFIDGFFRGDPHPGNILLNRDTSALTYIDFGLVGRLDQPKRMDLTDLLFSFQQNDAVSLASLALRVSRNTRPVHVNRFREDMSEMLNQYVRYAPHPKFDTMISQFFALAKDAAVGAEVQWESNPSSNRKLPERPFLKTV
jgi:ubiquinone biosynthesis protein